MADGRARWPRPALAATLALCAVLARPGAADGEVAPADDRAPSADTVARSLPPTVYPDGRGLPEGSGSARAGAGIYRARCAGCHGANGEGGRAVELVGDRATRASDYPDRGIGAAWPYAPPLFDYVRRAMPPDAPYSLGVEDTYAVLARLLELNGLVGADAVIDRAALAALEMPARADYYRADE